MSHITDEADGFTDDTDRAVAGQEISAERFELGLEFTFSVPLATGSLALSPEASYVLSRTDGGDHGNSSNSDRGRVGLAIDYRRSEALRMWVETFFDGVGDSATETYGVKLGVEASF